MKDAKKLHGEILSRERDDWRDGWSTRHDFTLGICWGVVVMLAVLVLL